MRLNHLPFAIHHSQRGFALVGIVIAILFVFSIMIVSGSTTFPDTPDLISDNDNKTETPPPADSSSWSISYTPIGCIEETTPEMETRVTVKGISDGYITIETISDSSTKIILTYKFTSPETTYKLFLSNVDSFNTLSWKINLYEGDVGSGGTLKTTYDGSPTGC